MKINRVLLVFVALFFLSDFAMAQVHVRGYYRKDGTYVRPHVRSSPDGNPYNNYSFPGNTNPYTGKVATGNPDTYLKNYYDRSSRSTFSSSSYSSSSYSIPSIPKNSSSDLDYYPLRGTSVVTTPDLDWISSDYSNSTIPSYSGGSYFNSGYSRTQRAINYNNAYSFSDRKLIEQALWKLGHSPGSVDGAIDSETVAAIKAFQRRAGIPADGMVGPQTIRYMVWYLK